jgi:hypothetical protein
VLRSQAAELGEPPKKGVEKPGCDFKESAARIPNPAARKPAFARPSRVAVIKASPRVAANRTFIPVRSRTVRTGPASNATQPNGTKNGKIMSSTVQLKGGNAG